MIIMIVLIGNDSMSIDDNSIDETAAALLLSALTLA